VQISGVLAAGRGTGAGQICTIGRGKPSSRQPWYREAGGAPNGFRWVGRLGYYFEPDLNTYWLRARTYSQLAGRFLSRDPVLQTAGGQVPDGNPPGGWRTSLYIYPGNSPVVRVDPSGRQGYRGPGRRPEPVEAPTATAPLAH
jgi:RHS repeat-associated protein